MQVYIHAYTERVLDGCTGALLALDELNANANILPHHELALFVNDTNSAPSTNTHCTMHHTIHSLITTENCYTNTYT